MRTEPVWRGDGGTRLWFIALVVGGVGGASLERLLLTRRRGCVWQLARQWVCMVRILHGHSISVPHSCFVS